MVNENSAGLASLSAVKVGIWSQFGEGQAPGFSGLPQHPRAGPTVVLPDPATHPISYSGMQIVEQPSIYARIAHKVFGNDAMGRSME